MKVKAAISNPILVRSGMVVYCRTYFSSSSFLRVLVIVGCEKPRTFAKSLSLLREFFINSYRSFGIFSGCIFLHILQSSI